jgi:hypothetical protein
LAPKLPPGAALIVLGVVLLLFGLFLAPLISVDLRSGHRYWVAIVTVDEVVAVALILTGFVQRHLGGKSAGS